MIWHAVPLSRSGHPTMRLQSPRPPGIPTLPSIGRRGRTLEPIFTIYLTFVVDNATGMWLDKDMTATTTNTGLAGERGSVMNFSNIPAGLLPAGTVTAFGTIVSTSYTAYEVESGEYIAFARIHGRPAPVMPLVVFG